MVERIIILICFFMCAVPFLIISIFNKNSMTPIAFWSGSENTLKNQVKNVKDYNLEMASLYKKCAIAFLITGVCSCIHPVAGMVMLGVECTLGIYFVYKKHKSILNQYS